jgi:hypothetical protein
VKALNYPAEVPVVNVIADFRMRPQWIAMRPGFFGQPQSKQEMPILGEWDCD